jgi:short chain dehydrogenase
LNRTISFFLLFSLLFDQDQRTINGFIYARNHGRSHRRGLLPDHQGQNSPYYRGIPGSLGTEFAQVICKYAPGLLILANRGTVKASKTAQTISDLTPSAPTPSLKLDLVSQTQVREAAKEVMEDYSEANIEVLVNNAGVMAGPHKVTIDGIEN